VPGNLLDEMILTCFAVSHEARFFKAPLTGLSGVSLLLTGMGAANAETALGHWFKSHPAPALVLTCGFAGGLSPRWKVGDVLVEGADIPGSLERWTAAGAQPGRFCEASTVLVTAAQKAERWQASAADAVEMESSALRRLCAARGIPCAIVRVISDAADEDLPLDFNRFMTPQMRLSYPRLLAFVAGHPAVIPALLAFQRRTALAARRLGEVLSRALAAQTGLIP